MPAKRGRPPKNRGGQWQADGQPNGPVESAAGQNSGVGIGDWETPRTPAESTGDLKPPPVQPSPQATFDPAKSDAGYTAPVGSPEAAAEQQATAETAKKPGRPAGSKNKIPVDVSGMEKLLFSIGTMLHHSTHIPEFAVSHDETKAIADAWAECAKYYPSMNLDPAIAAPVNLAGVLTIFVGTRITSFRMRKAMERRARPQPPPPPTPRAPTEFQPQPAMTQQDINGAPRPPEQERPIPSKAMRVGEIPGVGTIEFAETDPLVGLHRKPN